MTPHISACVCTYKRPELLDKLLRSLDAQRTEGEFTYSIVVSDNDITRSGESAVIGHRQRSRIPVEYLVEPRANIAHNRNRAVSAARGDFVAFVDDDEFAEPDWLLSLVRIYRDYSCDGVLGPVVPHFENTAPRWVTDGGFFQRPTHHDGFEIGLSEARTGNVLFHRSVFAGVRRPFNPRFGTGSEDVDFFSRLMAEGRRFVWSSRAVVHELVPSVRMGRLYLIRLALLRGGNAYKRTAGRLRRTARSLVAVPAYVPLLAVLLLVSYNRHLRLLISLCDHLGALAAVFGISIRSRR